MEKSAGEISNVDNCILYVLSVGVSHIVMTSYERRKSRGTQLFVQQFFMANMKNTNKNSAFTVRVWGVFVGGGGFP